MEKERKVNLKCYLKSKCSYYCKTPKKLRTLDGYHLNPDSRCLGCENWEKRNDKIIHSCLAYPIYRGIPSKIWNKPNEKCSYFIPTEEKLSVMAFEDNNGWAMVRLGNFCAERKEYKKAYEWYCLAEKTNSIDALDATFNIANMYYYGKLGEQDYIKAYERFSKLAEQGVEKALFYMGVYAEYGYIGGVDYNQAKEYYEEAIALGDDYSATNLGAMYCLGKGVTVDYQKGLEYYRMAYEQGDMTACCGIGYSYEKGQGVKKNKLLALWYYTEGVACSNEECLREIQRFKKWQIWPVQMVHNAVLFCKNWSNRMKQMKAENYMNYYIPR